MQGPGAAGGEANHDMDSLAAQEIAAAEAAAAAEAEANGAAAAESEAEEEARRVAWAQYYAWQEYSQGHDHLAASGAASTSTEWAGRSAAAPSPSQTPQLQPQQRPSPADGHQTTTQPSLSGAIPHVPAASSTYSTDISELMMAWYQCGFATARFQQRYGSSEAEVARRE